ncbi:hypothetical protein ABK040_002800 [Willaertia magna]
MQPYGKRPPRRPAFHPEDHEAAYYHARMMHGDVPYYYFDQRTIYTWDYIFGDRLLLSTIFDYVDESDFLNFINYLKGTEHKDIIESGDSRYDIWNNRCFIISSHANNSDLIRYLIEYVISPQPSCQTPEIMVHFKNNYSKKSLDDKTIRMIPRLKFLTFTNILFLDSKLKELLTSPNCKIKSINFIDCIVSTENRKKELEISNSTIQHLSITSPTISKTDNTNNPQMYSGDYITLQLPNLQSFTHDAHHFLKKNFFGNHKDILQEIDVTTYKANNLLLSLQNVSLPNVTTLTIDSVKNANLYTKFPNIKHLTLKEFSSNSVVKETVETLVLPNLIEGKLDLKELLRHIHLNIPNLKHLIVTDGIVKRMIANNYDDNINITDFIYPLGSQIKQLLEVTVIYTKKANPLILDALKREINIIAPYAYIKFKLATKQEIDLGYNFYDWKPFSGKAEQLLRKLHQMICKLEMASFGTLTKSFVERYVACCSCEETMKSFYRLNMFVNYSEKEYTCRYYYFEKTLAKRKEQYEIYKDTIGAEDELALNLRLKIEGAETYLKKYESEILSDLQLSRRDLKRLHSLQKEMEDISHQMYIVAVKYFPHERLFDMDKWFNPEFVEVFDKTEEVIVIETDGNEENEENDDDMNLTELDENEIDFGIDIEMDDDDLLLINEDDEEEE